MSKSGLVSIRFRNPAMLAPNVRRLWPSRTGQRRAIPRKIRWHFATERRPPCRSALPRRTFRVGPASKPQHDKRCGPKGRRNGPADWTYFKGLRDRSIVGLFEILVKRGWGWMCAAFQQTNKPLWPKTGGRRTSYGSGASRKLDDFQAFHSAELGDIVGEQSATVVQRRGGNDQVMGADHFAFLAQLRVK